MADQVLRMTTAHVARWAAIHGCLVVVLTWLALNEASTLARVVEVAVGLLNLRGLVGSMLAFARRPALTIGPEALTIQDVVRTRDVRWTECSEFRPIHKMLGSHVRYRVGERRKSLPAGFGPDNRSLTAEDLADALNRARAAIATQVSSVHEA
jgi:hypothetical protein